MRWIARYRVQQWRESTRVSAGNPFYAIELARALLDSAGETLPSTLADLVRARIGSLDPAEHGVLLAAACLASPTVELVGDATDVDHDQLIELLEAAERHGIIFIEGNRIRFAHPLLASGVYTDASPTQRRLTHRRLADVVDETELRARHLALASSGVRINPLLRDALAVFEQLGTELWANRARAELAGRRTREQPRRPDALTPAELRVAELAASGMTNRDVAAELFISSKTVEATLARVYRKLGVQSRAELGQRVGKTAT
jgi:DNA-binding NarL/FixJ family response regulator